jgi:hypothetical protein
VRQSAGECQRKTSASSGAWQGSDGWLGHFEQLARGGALVQTLPMNRFIDCQCTHRTVTCRRRGLHISARAKTEPIEGNTAIAQAAGLSKYSLC